MADEFATREEVLTQYRRLRDLMRRHADATVPYRSPAAFKDAAKRIGLWSGGRLVANDASELTLAMDLVVFGSNNGRSRAIDRYARQIRLKEGSEEAMTLAAIQSCRFHLLKVRDRHRLAGLVVEDYVSGEEL